MSPNCALFALQQTVQHQQREFVSIDQMLRSWLTQSKACLGSERLSLNYIIKLTSFQGSETVTIGPFAQCLHTSPSSEAPQQQYEADVEDLQQQLLEKALCHVKREGWTQTSLTAAARDLQLSPAVVGLFHRGPSQLVEHFIAQQNAALERELQEIQQKYMDLPLKQRITAAVRRRLELNIPHLESWPQALALLSQPTNAPAALKLLLQLLDVVWYSAGDQATDNSWYTKRAALASIYLSTELYMLTDYSPGFADTWQQLERRVDDVLWLEAAVQNAGTWPQLLLQALLQMSQSHQHADTAAGAAGQSSPNKASAHSSSSSSSSSGGGGGGGGGGDAMAAAKGSHSDASCT